MPEEQMSTPQGGPSSGDSTTNNPEGASNDLQSQNTKLRQELARAKEIMQQAAPVAQLGDMLQRAPGGKEIIERLQANKPLTGKQTDAAAEKLRAEGVSEERIVELLQQGFQKFEEDSRLGREAEREIQALHERAKKEFPGYENVYKSQEFKRLEDIVLTQAQRAFKEGRSVIPGDEPDPYWWIKKEAWKILKAKNPEMLTEKPAGKTEAERRGAISSQSGKSGGAPEAQQDDLPDYVKNLGTRKFGGRLSDLRGKSRKH